MKFDYAQVAAAQTVREAERFVEITRKCSPISIAVPIAIVEVAVPGSNIPIAIPIAIVEVAVPDPNIPIAIPITGTVGKQ